MDRRTAEKVHVIFKTHLDVGFTDLAANVVARYFSEFIPSALDTAAALRDSGSPDRFVWTTGSWLIYEYLEQAGPRDRARLESAIAAGDITWHALPFTLHCELMEPSLFRFGLSLSRELDLRFGHTTIAAKLTDVPGHTRGIVPLLAEAGVEFLHVGVNEASPMPDVPPLFVWRDARTATEVVVMYHNGYGATMPVVGIGDCLAFAHTMDNRGPQRPDEVTKIFADLRRDFPHAQVTASTLDDFARALRSVRRTLPVVTSEIGDTWIHGVASDPSKVARFRALSRLRASWLQSGPAAAGDSYLAEFSRRLLLVPEHTWGADDKTHLAEYDSYTASRFQSAATSAPFVFMARSWDEQRSYIDSAIAALEGSAWHDSALATCDSTRARRPDTTAMDAADLKTLSLSTGALGITLSPDTGAITTLIDLRHDRELSDAAHPLGLFACQVYSHRDYERFLDQYVTGDHEWAEPDFGKPGLERAGISSARFTPRLRGSWHTHGDTGDTVVSRLALDEEAVATYGCPREIYLTVHVPISGTAFDIELQWFEKPASRLPQAYWLSFVPRVGIGAEWVLEKLGCHISPRDVVRNGNRRTHAVGEFAACRSAWGTFRVTTMDAPVVRVGTPALLEFTNADPDPADGLHVNLYNNVWGTNFPSWYEQDSRFRFRVSVEST